MKLGNGGCDLIAILGSRGKLTIMTLQNGMLVEKEYQITVDTIVTSAFWKVETSN